MGALPKGGMLGVWSFSRNFYDFKAETTRFFSSFLFLLLAPICSAQSVVVKTVLPKDEDVKTLDGLIRAFYEVVNGAPEEPRQWDRDRTLYVPWIRFIATSIDKDKKVKTNIWTHQEYVEATEPLVKAGFKEWEVSRKVSVYGNVAHIDSVYEGESTSAESGELYKFGGLNSLEAYFDGERWWISSVSWMSSSPDHPIPERFQSRE